MAYEQQNWKDALQAAKSEGSRPDDNADQRKQKKQSRLMYTKRVLQKEIKQLLTQKVIKFTEIERIHNKHGIHIT